MIRNIFLITIIAFININVAISQGKIQFEKLVHDFGEIKEEAGEVTYKFQFKNTGNAPVIIQNVKASCGCTTPEWTQKPVLPNATGFVAATYDPYNRPGHFSKEINITTNVPGQEHITLIIKGNVDPRSKTVADLFPSQIGDLRLKKTRIPLAKVYNTETKTYQLEVTNTTSENLKIEFTNVPSHIKIKAKPEVLSPGYIGEFEITYDAKAKNDYDFVTDKVFLTINNQLIKDKHLLISATIFEDFRTMTAAQKANAPTLSIKSKTFNFGTIKQGENKEIIFELKNTGKTDLKIRKSSSNCDCLDLTDIPQTIKAGESYKLKASFKSSGKKGRQNKIITLITNDPDKPKIVLWVKGEVEA